jgi:phosphopantetheinyl transferase (holo-ACP synthase)
MYAKLAEEGIVVEDYWNIKKFSTLIEKVNGNGHSAFSTERKEDSGNIALPPVYDVAEATVGIDLEEIDAMPKANDFREDEFYKMNFSSTEIAYCILQPNPYASFAGLFAAKEAIVKANNSNKSRPFNTIIINHNGEGKPIYPGFNLSVSHTNNVAVAIALPQENHGSAKKANDPIGAQPPSRSGTGMLLFIISFLISLAALIISLLK